MRATLLLASVATAALAGASAAAAATKVLPRPEMTITK
jgi:hypothetical protein